MVIFHKGYSTVLHFYTTKCPIKQFSFRPTYFYVSEIVLQCNLQCNFNWIAKIFNYIYFVYIFHGAQTSELCAYFNPLQTNYIHVHMPDGQQWEVFGNAVLPRVGSLNTLLNLPVEKDCVRKAKPRARGTKPLTLFYWMKAKVYPKCR